MAPRRLFGGNGKGNGPDDGPRSREERMAFLQVSEARGRRINVPPLVTCDPSGNEDSIKLENHLRANVEPELRDQAGAAAENGRTMYALEAISDKSYLTGITLLGGEDCGNKALSRFMAATAQAMGDVEAANGAERNGLYLARLGRRSDEGAQVIGAVDLSPNADIQFRMALELEMQDMAEKGLAGVGYVAEVRTPDGIEQRELTLKAFSRMLDHPEIVVAGNFKIARPMVVTESSPAGFLLDGIRKLENAEAPHFEKIPRVYNGNGGLPEVRTPFKGCLKGNGTRSMPNGTFVEIKLSMAPELAKEFLKFTADKRDGEGRLIEAGTRKGYSEIFSLRAGMRFLNTFFGKARSNSILTPIALAMGDVQAMGIDVVPVAGGYLQYWLNAPDRAAAGEMVAAAIRRRINGVSPTDDIGYINVKFEPSVLTLDAAGMDFDDVRAEFILKSLEKGTFPAAALARADFLVSFLWLIRDNVQKQMFTDLADDWNGGSPVRMSDLEMVRYVKWVMSLRRTIRDTEDLVWTLRNDPALPPEIASKRGEIEKWFWDFSWARQPGMFALLSDYIRREMDKGNG